MHGQQNIKTLFINLGVCNRGFFNDSATYRNEYQEYILGVKAADA